MRYDVLVVARHVSMPVSDQLQIVEIDNDYAERDLLANRNMIRASNARRL
jgi:hypothetical protein